MFRNLTPTQRDALGYIGNKLWKPDKCQSIIVDGKAASTGGAAVVKMR